jgi:hypothetical protein
MPGCSDFAEFIPMKLKGSGGSVRCAVHCRAPFPFTDALFPQAGRIFAMRQHLRHCGHAESTAEGGSRIRNGKHISFVAGLHFTARISADLQSSSTQLMRYHFILAR